MSSRDRVSNDELRQAYETISEIVQDGNLTEALFLWIRLVELVNESIMKFRFSKNAKRIDLASYHHCTCSLIEPER